MKLVIAGNGAVGKAVSECLRDDRLDIFVDDPAKGYEVDPYLLEPDGVVVCVATPMREDGTCNTDNVNDVFDKYGDTKYLIKSAVDPVWLDRESKRRPGSFTYSPEFLGSSNINRNPTQEFLKQTFAIYGGDDPRFWDELFKPFLSDLKEVKYCTLQQAAFAKYVENCFLATKVTFFNEMYRIFNEIGFEGFDQMVDAITLDPRIGKSHTQVPGPDGKFGYGGHCFPKDVAALRSISKNTPLLDSVSDINEEIRR